MGSPTCMWGDVLSVTRRDSSGIGRMRQADRSHHGDGLSAEMGTLGAGEESSRN